MSLSQLGSTSWADSILRQDLLLSGTERLPMAAGAASSLANDLVRKEHYFPPGSDKSPPSLLTALPGPTWSSHSHQRFKV